MKKLLAKSFLFLVPILLFTSCFQTIYGMKGAKDMDEKNIQKTGDRYKIPQENSFQLDTAYVGFLRALENTEFKHAQKNHYQPLQALYYTVDGNLTSYQVNCYAGGFPNLEWERDSIMSKFPPLQQAPIDSLLPLQKHLEYLMPINNQKKIDLTGYDYVVIVHWSRIMGRQSKRLIRTVQENCKLSSDQKVKVLYVNTDNFLILINS